MVKSTCWSLRGPEFDSQRPQQVAYSHMELQLQELQLYLLAVLYTHGIYSRRHRCRSNKNENKIFKMKNVGRAILTMGLLTGQEILGTISI